MYDIRAEARGFEAPFPINYLVSFADNLLPVLMIYLLTRRRWLFACAVMLVIFINFSISGQKQSLFVPMLGIIGFFAFKEYVKTYALLLGCILFTVACVAQAYFYDEIALHGIFTYRVLFIPTELNYSYYSYFQNNRFLYYNESLLKIFNHTPHENIQFLIGEFAIGDFTARANNGLFSDAYMNLGFVGVLIYPVILSALLRVIDGAVVGLPKSMIFVVVVYVSFVLISNTVTAALLTSGLIFLVILLYSFPRQLSGQRAKLMLPDLGMPVPK
ncbi:hypothetical protein [Sphingomonas hankookensis]|uniref:hypothetical protein n=1 Tax=Sphingomonas hankookensis TaxID=563996 RepID=UPI001F567066|nr:hypothetical protein [Sphingomonas hankookensis]